jgi:flagellin FlaB
MTSKLKQLLRDERGITALETAIILIAFVVVASVFAFTILSAGTFSTERGREAIYAGLEQVSSSMEVYGSVYAERDPITTTRVMTLTFTLASVSGGSGTVITDSTASNANVVISYQDNDTYVKQLDYDVNWIVGGTDDDLLEEGELAEVEITLTSGQDETIDLNASESFKLEVKPPQGGVLPILRTTPASLDSVMSLN